VPVSRRAVEQRADWRCEYCRAPQRICGYRFHVEHIRPRALGGGDDASNLALACSSCNLAKGVRTEAVDPVSGSSTPLFNPRRQRWSEHFAWERETYRLVGTSAVGRATVVALDLNAPLRLEARAAWWELGWLP
jgi:HNH endonuclease